MDESEVGVLNNSQFFGFFFSVTVLCAKNSNFFEIWGKQGLALVHGDWGSLATYIKLTLSNLKKKYLFIIKYIYILNVGRTKAK